MSDKTADITPPAETSSKTFTLIDPIEIAGVKVHTLTLRKPKARDFRVAVSKKNVDTLSQQEITILIAANLANLAVEELDDLNVKDLLALTNYVESFF